MHLSSFKSALNQMEVLAFTLPDGRSVPAHLHMTEMGLVQKTFIDCGGQLRKNETIRLQLWTADDTAHRLSPEKLLGIIRKAERTLHLADLPMEVEYQGKTIELYGLELGQGGFELHALQTDCLAKEQCGIPEPQATVATSCAPSSGCC